MRIISWKSQRMEYAQRTKKASFRCSKHVTDQPPLDKIYIPSRLPVIAGSMSQVESRSSTETTAVHLQPFTTKTPTQQTSTSEIYAERINRNQPKVYWRFQFIYQMPVINL